MEGSHRALIPREETTLALPAFPTRTAMAGCYRNEAIVERSLGGS